MRIRNLGVAVAAAAALAGCSSSTGGAGAPAGSGGPAGSPVAAEKPKAVDDLERVCQDGLGFSGSKAYGRTRGKVHKLALMQKSKAGWIAEGGELDHLPAGWIVYYPGDPAEAELVSCYERTKATPAGKTCQMEDDKTHKPFTLTMYNTTYRLRIIETRTGKVLYDKPGTAASTDCPSFTTSFGDDDRTKYYTEASPADYRGVLKQFITP